MSEPERLTLSPKRPRVLIIMLIAVVVVLLGAVAVRLGADRGSAGDPPGAVQPTGAPGSHPAPPQSRSSSRIQLDRTVYLDQGPRDARASIDVYAYGDGKLLRLEPARWQATVTRVPIDSSGPVTLVPLTDGAVVLPIDTVPGYFVDDDRPVGTQLPAIYRGATAFPGPDTGHTWVVADGQDTASARLVDRTGAPAATLMLPGGASAFTVYPDQAGYLIVGGGSGYYTTDRRGLHRLNASVLLAIGRTTFLTEECETGKRCTVYRIDRRTGARSPIAGLSLPTNAEPGVISPDGRRAALSIDDGDGRVRLLMIDLPSGKARRYPIAPLPSNRAMVWSPDSRWFFTADNQHRLWAMQARSTGMTPTMVDAPRLKVDAIGIRA